MSWSGAKCPLSGYRCSKFEKGLGGGAKAKFHGRGGRLLAVPRQSFSFSSFFTEQMVL